MNADDLAQRIQTLESIEAIKKLKARYCALCDNQYDADEVDADTATGQWYLFQPCTLAEGNQAAWLTGRYEERYEKRDGEWKFKYLSVTPFFFTPYGDGWVKTPFLGQ